MKQFYKTAQNLENHNKVLQNQGSRASEINLNLSSEDILGLILERRGSVAIKFEAMEHLGGLQEAARLLMSTSPGRQQLFLECT